jgi:hypothetical protein
VGDEIGPSQAYGPEEYFSWRQMGRVQRGFKTQQGRIIHLKVFQLIHYLEKLSLKKIIRE